MWRGRIDKRTQVEGIRIWTHVEFVRPLTYLPIETNTGRQNKELNTCEICASSDVPTYIKMQNPIQIYPYTYDFNCKIIMKKCLAVGWVQGKLFLLYVSVKRLYTIHITLKDCIRFSESKHPSIISPINYVWERNTISELISTVYNQHKSLVSTNNKKYSLTWDMIRFKKIITWIRRDLCSRSNKFFKTYALKSDDSSVKKNLQ